MRTLTWPALGTTAVLQVADGHEGPARAAVVHEIEAIDRAASRFRDDSELSALNHAGGRRVTISALLLEALQVALDAARVSGGAVDPTLGQCLIDLGYDRDFARLSPVATTTPLDEVDDVEIRVPAWRAIELRDDPPSARIPAHVRLDLGATAKALAADRAARAAHLATGAGVLLSLGGDIATAGSGPGEGWRIRVTDDHRDVSGDGQTVSIASGGLATSSLLTRRWCQDGCTRHHILDPRTGSSVRPYWRTASVAAATCTGANIASTAAVVLGEHAAGWLSQRTLPARLVAIDGHVCVLGDWPA